jgi:hypothetical protein
MDLVLSSKMGMLHLKVLENAEIFLLSAGKLPEQSGKCHSSLF